MSSRDVFWGTVPYNVCGASGAFKVNFVICLLCFTSLSKNYIGYQDFSAYSPFFLSVDLTFTHSMLMALVLL